MFVCFCWPCWVYSALSGVYGRQYRNTGNSPALFLKSQGPYPLCLLFFYFQSLLVPVGCLMNRIILVAKERNREECGSSIFARNDQYAFEIKLCSNFLPNYWKLSAHLTSKIQYQKGRNWLDKMIYGITWVIYTAHKNIMEYIYFESSDEISSKAEKPHICAFWFLFTYWKPCLWAKSLSVSLFEAEWLSNWEDARMSAKGKRKTKMRKQTKKQRLKPLDAMRHLGRRALSLQGEFLVTSEDMRDRKVACLGTSKCVRVNTAIKWEATWHSEEPETQILLGLWYEFGYLTTT